MGTVRVNPEKMCFHSPAGEFGHPWSYPVTLPGAVPPRVACGASWMYGHRAGELRWYLTFGFFPVSAMLCAVNIPPIVFKEKRESCLIFPVLIERSHAFSTSYCIIPLAGVALI